MLRLFDDSQVAHNHQHIQLVIEMVPSEPLKKEQGNEILARIKKVIAEYEVPIMAQASITSHRLAQCTPANCSQLRPLFASADAEYHRRRGDEH